MKTHLKLLSAVLCILCSYAAFGQPFGNEWVNPNQEYLKIQVKEDGIYRVSYQEILQAGFPINTIDPRRLQLWFRGQQRAIWIEGEADGTFDEGDYIEFYGQLNDATLDAELYDKPENVPNPYRNLYSNHTSYFLTYPLDGSFGKRMSFFYESNTSITALTYYKDRYLINATSGQQGQEFPAYLTYGSKGAYISTLTEGTGFIHATVGQTDAKDRIFTIELPGKYIVANQGDMLFSWYLQGYSNGPHKAEVYVGPSTDKMRLIASTELEDYQAYRIDKEVLLASDISPNSSNFFAQLKVLDASPSIVKEVMATGVMELIFPRTSDLLSAPSADLTLPISSTGRSRMLLQNPATGARVFDITDPNSLRRIGTDIINGQLNAIVDKTQTERTVLVTSEIKAPDFIESVSFSPIPTQVNYLLVSHKDLMLPSQGYDNPVQAYADYRSSTSGGSNKVYLGEINELFNYFSYGEPTPAAIRRCIKYLQSKGNTIDNLFLVGKGLDVVRYYYFNLPASASWPQRNLVPCMGMPCSDVLYTANLYENTGDISTIPTGRLSALNATHVADYLNKVKDHESQTYDNLPRKNTLFLSGGATNFERRLLKDYMEEFAALTENKHLGGKSKLYSKETTGAVELFDVSKEVNEGLNVITMFGHTATNFTDIDIQTPQSGVFNYNNKGKYPMLIVNGCNSGDIFQRAFSLGEYWTVAAEKGAIAYIAHSDLGYPSKLRYHTLSVLRELYTDSTTIHQSIGKALLRAQEKFINIWPNDPLSRAQLHQYTFQGDPAVKLFPPNKPDYHLSNDGLFIENLDKDKTVTADTDAFRIGIVVSNFGITKEDPISIRVKRTFNNGINGEKWYDEQIFDRVYYQDTLYYTIEATDLDKQNAVGINKFEVYLDQNNAIAEMNEGNNTASFDYVFPRSAIRLLFPEKYGIVAKQPVKLNAQNLDMLPIERDYLFEIDTTDTFNSPFLKRNTVQATFNPSWSIEQLISDNAKDSIVYYWRVKFANIGELDDASWVASSFIYIKDSPKGWAQSHMPQFKEASLIDLQPIETRSEWAFTTDTIRISMKTTGGRGAWADQFIKYNDFSITEAGRCGADKLLFIAVDHKTGEIYNKIEGVNYFATCGNLGTLTPVMRVMPTLAGFAGYLAYITNNFLDSGDYIFMMSSRNMPLGSLRNVDMEALERMGIPLGTLGNTVRAGEPFIALGRLDVPGYEAQIFTADPTITDSIPKNQQEVFADFVLPIQKRLGTAVSSRIGPASNWGNSKHYFGKTDSNSEKVTVDLIGIGNDGSEHLIMTNLPPVATDLSGISSNNYPYLKLKATFEDVQKATPRSLDHWEVIYEGLPEGLLHFEGATANFQEPLTFGEGEEANFSFKFENVSEVDFQSPIVFQYTLKKPNNTVITAYDTLANLPSGASITYNKSFNTLGSAGKNELTVFANPLSQQELLYDNNLLQRQFEVTPDRINPILDVAFDGVRIMDGDIVSPTPIISIGLTDENPYYTLSDTASLALYLSTVNTAEFIEINTEANPAVKWVEQGENKLRIEYSPESLADGKYRLKVQARDASGNASGAQPYEISFEVINASQITHFYPYPNPFSTSVRFVFTLTGDKLPDNLRIQIMTVTGKVVREITQQELGGIHIGNNITQYAWDGKDEYGDQLANGTYLYRVIADYQGQAIERRTTSRDNLFKNNMGKMYLLR